MIGSTAWAPRPWRVECRRQDLERVGRFEYERVLRRPEVELSAGGIAVVLVLATFADRHGGSIFPSQETLARICRRSVRHVRAKLREATELGFLRRLSHGGGRPGRKRDGSSYRVTPARYELTLPRALAASRRQERAAQHGSSPAHVDPRSSKAPGGSAASFGTPTPAPSSPRPESRELEPSASDIEQVRSALGVPGLTSSQVESAMKAALARAPGDVRHPLRYALEVIRRNPAFFRPVPEVVEPRCTTHSDQPATRCPLCASEVVRPNTAWKAARERLRRRLVAEPRR